MRLCCYNNIAQAFTIGQLSKHEHGELVIAGKLLDITITAVFVRNPEEYLLIDEI